MPKKPNRPAVQVSAVQNTILNKLTFLNPAQPFHSEALQPWEKFKLDAELATHYGHLNPAQKFDLGGLFIRWGQQLRLAAMAANSKDHHEQGQKGWEPIGMWDGASVPEYIRMVEDLRKEVAAGDRTLAFIAQNN